MNPWVLKMLGSQQGAAVHIMPLRATPPRAAVEACGDMQFARNEHCRKSPTSNADVSHRSILGNFAEIFQMTVTFEDLK